MIHRYESLSLDLNLLLVLHTVLKERTVARAAENRRKLNRARPSCTSAFTKDS